MRNKIIALYALICIMFTLIPSSAATAAADSGNAFDKTNVMDDLAALGNDFETERDSISTVGIINFTEYCYSDDTDQRDNYALYVYMYAADGSILNLTADNKIQLAVTFGDENVSEYVKLGLTALSVSTGDNANKYIKFKVQNASSLIEGKTGNPRAYSISGIELYSNKYTTSPHDYKVGKTYTFSGYAKGYGSDTTAESTLTTYLKDLDTISLNVTQSSYLYWNSANSAKQISTAIFSVPNEYITNYGSLQKIHAEWYEYLLKNIIVTNNKDLNSALTSYLNTDIGDYNKDVGYRLCLPIGDNMGNYWSYNSKDSAQERLTRLMYLYYSSGDLSDISVPGTKISEYIRNTLLNYYNDNIATSPCTVNSSAFAEWAFGNNIETNRIRGYNNINIDANDTYDLKGLSGSDAFKWFYNALYPNVNTDNYNNISPIVALKLSDFSLSDKTTADNLLIDENDVSDLKNLYAIAAQKNETVFLFRFAVTDYTTNNLTVYKDSLLAIGKKDWAYKAAETIFLDFDIIDLTFQKENVFTTIASVSDPIDVIGDIVAPQDPDYENFFKTIFPTTNKIKDWVKWLIFAIITIVAVFILYAIIKTIVKTFVSHKKNTGYKRR